MDKVLIVLTNGKYTVVTVFIARLVSAKKAFAFSVVK
jgi:hypothetical protein